MTHTMGPTNVNYSTSLPTLNGKNWDQWRVQMKAILDYQEVIEIVEEGFPVHTTDATYVQKALTKKIRRKIGK